MCVCVCVCLCLTLKLQGVVREQCACEVRGEEESGRMPSSSSSSSSLYEVRLPLEILHVRA